MPKEVFAVSPIADLSIASINRLVTDINNALAHISDEVATIEGIEGRTPKFENDIDFSNKRLCNVGHTRVDSDVPNRKELVDRALYVRADTRKHHANEVIVASKGIEVPFAAAPQQAPNLAQLKEEIVIHNHDHGTLTGTGDDDHSQYYLANGTRAISGPIDHNGSTVGFYGTTPVAQSSAYTPSNESADRAFDANAAAGTITSPPTQAEVENIRDTVLELADVVATVINDLKLTGLLG